jgi:hypothetical protein
MKLTIQKRLKRSRRHFCENGFNEVKYHLSKGTQIANISIVFQKAPEIKD